MAFLRVVWLIVLLGSPVWADTEQVDLDEAKLVARHFLEIESSGKRLYTDKSYRQLMDYDSGDEPGWDRVRSQKAVTPESSAGLG
jgi:hypothetical protein